MNRVMNVCSSVKNVWKKVLSVSVSIVLCIGLAVPAYADHHGEAPKTKKQVETKAKGVAKAPSHPDKLPRVVMETTSGKLLIELYPKKAPETVKNFLQYVNDKFYDGTIFHRIVPGFVIQGGGFTYDFKQKPTRAPIVNEASNGLKNGVATLSMARTNAPNSATSQFFINTVDNTALDPSPRSAGYAVFGKVIEGFNIVKKIEREPRGLYRQHPEAPNYPVIIEKAYVLKNQE